MKRLISILLLAGTVAASAQNGFRNSAGNVLPTVTTLVSNDVFLAGTTGSPISPTNKNVRAGQLLPLLENLTTNHTLRVGGGVGWISASNYVASGIPSLELNIFTGTNAFLWNIGDASGRKGKLYVNTIHNGSDATDDHNVEWQWQSPAHIAYGVGYGYGNKGHFQWGIGAANTNNGGVWGYQQAQRDLSGSIPYGYSAADTYRVNWKSNGATFTAYPGFVGEALGTDDYSLTFLANLFNDWIDSASGSDQWRPDTMIRSMQIHRSAQTNWLDFWGDIVARRKFIGDGSGLTNLTGLGGGSGLTTNVVLNTDTIATFTSGSLTAIAPLDADAKDWFTRASVTNFLQMAAVNTLVTDLKAANAWTNFSVIYIPLKDVAAMNGENLKGNTFDITWTGSPAHTNDGVGFNGSSNYGDTGFNPTSDGYWSQNSASLLLWSGTVTPAGGVVFAGAMDGASNRGYLWKSGTDVKTGGLNNNLGGAIASATNDFSGLMVANRDSSTTQTASIRDITSSVDSVATVGNVNNTLAIGARHFDTGVNFDQFVSFNFRFMAAGAGMDSTKLAAVKAAVKRCGASLGWPSTQ